MDQAAWLLGFLTGALLLLGGAFVGALLARRVLRFVRRVPSQIVVQHKKALANTQRHIERALRAHAQELRREIRYSSRHSAKRDNALLQRLRSADTVDNAGVAVPLPSPPRSAEYDKHGYLAVVLFAKNETAQLREWLAFQRVVGIEHVFLYDHGCSDEALAVAAEFSKAGYLTRIPWIRFAGDVNPQTQAYAHALCNFGPHWRWLAFIDADEFLFPTEGSSLPKVLRKYENVPAVGVYWRIFGFSGHQQPPSGLVIENFIERAPFPPEVGSNRNLVDYKSIVDPSRIVGVQSAHRFVTDTSMIGPLSLAGRLSLGGPAYIGYVCSCDLRLNHYFTKSEAEFERKLKNKDSVVGFWLDRTKQAEITAERVRLLEANPVVDKEICRFAPALRQAFDFDR